MALSTAQKAYLGVLAKGGDLMAKAILESSLDVSMTAAAEAANIIKVTGQIVDGTGAPVAGVQHVLLTSVPVAGAGTMTDGGDGAVVAGSASKVAVMTTTAAGKFQVDVTNVNVESNVLIAQVNGGDASILVLTFA